MTLPSRLLVITDRAQARRSIDRIAEEICAPDLCDWLLFRDKDMPREDRRTLAFRLRAITRAAGTRFSISADIALACDCEADGVHLQTIDAVKSARAGSTRPLLMGLSMHAPHDSKEACVAGVDYVTLSPIFSSVSKPDYGPALGLAGIAKAADGGGAVFALAGIEPENAGECLRAGAAGVAVMGGVMRADDPAAAVAAFRRALDATTARRAG